MNAHLRCKRCRMLGELCVCSCVRQVETQTRLVLLVHRIEDRKPTNTGRLATLCLPNSAIVVRGHEGEPTAPMTFGPETQPLFLFPHEGATPLAELPRPDKPVTLLVPDGNWRQASKVKKRVPGLADVPCVFLPAGEPSTYRLRAEAHPHGMATLEAIARAFRILEGPHVEEALLHVFRAMVERTLWARGTIKASEVEVGIPEGAMRQIAPRD